MRGTRYMGRSEEWYFAKALAAINGAACEKWFVHIAPRICVCAGSIATAGYSAVLSYNTGIFEAPIHVFDPEDSAVLRAQWIYWKMVWKLGKMEKLKCATKK